MTTSALDTAKLALVAGAAVVAFFVVKKVADVGPKALQAVNPFNHDNVFATGVNAAVDAVAPADSPGRMADGSITGGSWLWAWLNPDAVAAERALTAPTNAVSGTWDN